MYALSSGASMTRLVLKETFNDGIDIEPDQNLFLSCGGGWGATGGGWRGALSSPLAPANSTAIFHVTTCTCAIMPVTV